MVGERASLIQPQVVVQHVSAQGATVTHVRGTLIASGRENLRELGVFDEYARRLPARTRDAVLYALPSSWIPIEVASAHYHTCDELELSGPQIARLGELSAARMIDTFFGRGLRIARNAGAESYGLLLSRIDWIYDRMYQGGSVTVLQIGPKDVWHENTGQPLVSCRFWRALYLAYMEAVARAFAKVAYVKLARPRSAAANAIAVTGSWV